jgi:Tol biopolymer transport system component
VLLLRRRTVASFTIHASNPTVSPDGRTIAFQLSIDGPVEGAGQGILLFDLEAFEDGRES